MLKSRLLTPILLLALVACGGTSAVSTDEPATATKTADIYAALPQSKTPEGYHVLGRADAPITMQHYSDFL